MKNYLNNIQSFEGLNTDELYVWGLELEEMKMAFYSELEEIESDEEFQQEESFLNKLFARLNKLLSSAIEASSIKEEGLV
ncbi:hypothetical protein NQZ71_13265 [Niallia taxi]|uniref:hypothetical protein n=1 Tax=Niallia taxi TaxID=2499688 RepID=UPI002934A441|nr:hypothetical protein [Niallia taxi]WOD61785.1 hypothetical protein NQZ71_13265 [Niallia taxi]